MHFKQFKTNQIPNQTKSGCIKVGEFFKRLVKLRLQDNDIEMLLTQNEGKSVVAERFIRTLKNKIYTNIWLQYRKICTLTRIIPTTFLVLASNGNTQS